MIDVQLRERADGRNELILERMFAQPIARVWWAVTTSEEVSRWYPATVTIPDLAVGAEMAVDYGDGWTTSAVITELAEPNVFGFTERSLDGMPNEGDGEIRIELSGIEARTRMVFTQVFDDRPAAASYGAGWIGCFAVLDALMNGVEPPKDTTFVERHEGLIAQLGLDSGTLEVGDAGWEIRFERQLMRQSIPDVWKALMSGGEPTMGDHVPENLVPEAISVGVVVTVEPGVSISFPWLVNDEGAGSIRWALSQGPGGARIHIDQKGMTETLALADEFYSGWHHHMEQFVQSLP